MKRIRTVLTVMVCILLIAAFSASAFAVGIDSEEKVAQESAMRSPIETPLAFMGITLESGQSSVPADNAPVYDSTGPVVILPSVILCLAVAAIVFFVLKRRR